MGVEREVREIREIREHTSHRSDVGMFGRLVDGCELAVAADTTPMGKSEASPNHCNGSPAHHALSSCPRIPHLTIHT